MKNIFLQLGVALVLTACGGSSNNDVDANDNGDGKQPDADSGKCNPLAPFNANNCPAEAPKCSFQLISAQPVVFQTNCSSLISGTPGVGFVACGCADEDGDQACDTYRAADMNPTESCGLEGLDTPNDPADDKTYNCVVEVGGNQATNPPREQIQRCEQHCAPNDDPTKTGCPQEFNCIQFSDIFDDVPQSVGLCQPACDPMADPRPSPNGVLGTNCTLPAQQCAGAIGGIGVCYAPRANAQGQLETKDTFEACDNLRNCSNAGESCIDFDLGAGDAVCGKYCDPMVADKNQETFNTTANSLSTCGAAMLNSDHPSKADSANFICLPSDEIYTNGTAEDGACHHCAPTGVNNQPCCDPNNPTMPNQDNMGNVFCYGSCLEHLGCPVPPPAQNPHGPKHDPFKLLRGEAPGTELTVNRAAN